MTVSLFQTYSVTLRQRQIDYLMNAAGAHWEVWFCDVLRCVPLLLIEFQLFKPLMSRIREDDQSAAARSRPQ